MTQDEGASDTLTTPRVTVIVPMRNEERFIERCLASLLTGTYPSDQLEVLVWDGDSTDASAAIVQSLAETYPSIRLLRNEARLQSAAFNRSIGIATGEIVVRADAHTIYAPDYIAECVHLLRTSGAWSVGGRQEAVGESALGDAIAAAVSSRFAAGDATYRHGTKPAWVDTVYLGAWPRQVLERIGGMREDLAVNEDYEMNVRLRAAGGRILFSPTIRSRYFVRGSFQALGRQYARYGYWKVATLRLHPDSVRMRQLVAPAFVTSLVMSAAAAPWIGAWATAPALAYGVANLLASSRVATRRLGRGSIYLPFIFAVIHIAWGGGFLLGAVRRSQAPNNSSPGDTGDAHVPAV